MEHAVARAEGARELAASLQGSGGKARPRPARATGAVSGRRRIGPAPLWEGRALMRRNLVPQPLTAAAFAPFGDVIEMGTRFETINRGTAQAFADLARIDIAERGGRPRAGLYR